MQGLCCLLSCSIDKLVVAQVDAVTAAAGAPEQATHGDWPDRGQFITVAIGLNGDLTTLFAPASHLATGIEPSYPGDALVSAGAQARVRLE